MIACSDSAITTVALGRVVVDVGEQLAQLALGEEEAVGLVVGAVDRHADVVQQRRPPRPRPRRRGRASPWSATIAGSTPPLTSRRSRRRAMLSTTWTWTQEWSDIPSRSECTCAMCHQARTSASALTPSSSASSLRLPRVGARTARRLDRLGGRAAELARPGRRLARAGRARRVCHRRIIARRPTDPGPGSPRFSAARPPYAARRGDCRGRRSPAAPTPGWRCPSAAASAASRRCCASSARRCSPSEIRSPAGRGARGPAAEAQRPPRPGSQAGRPSPRILESAPWPSLLSIERRGEVAVVTLRRPEKRNALSIELRVELGRGLRGALGRRRRRLRRAHRRRQRLLLGDGHRASSAATAHNRERLVETSTLAFAGGRRLHAPGGRGGQRPGAGRRLRPRPALRPAGRRGSRRPSATPSCRAGSRPATRRRARCCRRPSPRSSASRAGSSRATEAQRLGIVREVVSGDVVARALELGRAGRGPAARGDPRDQAPDAARAPPPLGLSLRGGGAGVSPRAARRGRDGRPACDAGRRRAAQTTGEAARGAAARRRSPRSPRRPGSGSRSRPWRRSPRAGRSTRRGGWRSSRPRAAGTARPAPGAHAGAR